MTSPESSTLRVKSDGLSTRHQSGTRGRYDSFLGDRHSCRCMPHMVGALQHGGGWPSLSGHRKRIPPQELGRRIKRILVDIAAVSRSKIAYLRFGVRDV
jgi:hypothetical protein